MDVGIPVVVPAGGGNYAVISGPGVALFVIDLEGDFLAQGGFVEDRGVVEPQIEVRLGDVPHRHAVAGAVGAAPLAGIVIAAMIQVECGQDRPAVVS